MHASKAELPIAFEGDGVDIRHIEWGGLYCGLQTFPAGLDNAPFLKGLPDDRCQCPHWGYVLKGRMRVFYADREELVQSGDMYYMPPGHSILVEEDCDLIEFAPKQAFEETLEAVSRNLAVMQQT